MPLNTCLAFTSSQLGELRLCASRGCCLCPKRCQWLLQELCSSGTMCFPKTPIHFTQCSTHKMPAAIHIDHHLSIPIVLVSFQRFHFFLALAFLCAFFVSWKPRLLRKLCVHPSFPHGRAQKQMRSELAINPAESFPQGCFANSSEICHGCEIFHLLQ